MVVVLVLVLVLVVVLVVVLWWCWSAHRPWQLLRVWMRCALAATDKDCTHEGFLLTHLNLASKP